MKHNIFIAQNISKLRPKLEIEKCMVMPNGCAIDTEEHPRWSDETLSPKIGTNNLGLDLRPNGGLVITAIFPDSGEFWNFSYMGSECILWFDGNYSGGWNRDNAQTLWKSQGWFFGYIGGSGGGVTPRGHQNNALGIRPCKDYTSIDVPDGTKFYNAYTDGDGNVYDAVKIGNLLWTTENLKTTKFQDGAEITLGVGYGDFQYNDDTPLYTFYEYNTRGDYYKEFYGGLYNWYCVKNNIVSGDGWRVPTRQDLGALRSYLINTKWCDDVVVDGNNVSCYVKSCRQVNHPLDI